MLIGLQTEFLVSLYDQNCFVGFIPFEQLQMDNGQGIFDQILKDASDKNKNVLVFWGIQNLSLFLACLLFLSQYFTPILF
ncbi:MAG: hypothetical protein JEZ03_00470 [Bacteroidales bacterium]|nr:hypothetical protein [Bacteroidales bacterium]